MTTNKYTFIYEDNNDPIAHYPKIQNKLELLFEDGETWINVVERFLTFLETLYGYRIRNQVYYNLALPMNDENYSLASGREMDRETFEKLLKKHHKDLIPVRNFDFNDEEPESDENPSDS